MTRLPWNLRICSHADRWETIWADYAMKLFLTKEWGLEIPVLPLRFRRESDREDAFNKIGKRALVVYAGTKNGTKTKNPDDRGALLGMVEVEPVRVDARRYLTLRSGDKEDRERIENFQWPLGLAVKRAWEFPREQRPQLSDLAPRNKYPELHNRASGNRIVPILDDRLARYIQELPKERVPVKEPDSSDFSVVGRSTGPKWGAPPPTRDETMYEVKPDPKKRASTYVLEIVGSTPVAYKIGWANNIEKRMALFNHHAMPELGGLQYALFDCRPWENGRAAFALERALLEHFQAYRREDNTEIVTGIPAAKLKAALRKLYEQLKQLNERPSRSGRRRD